MSESRELISYAVQAAVMGAGNVSELSTEQRVELVRHLCEAAGLNPLFMPFRFLQFERGGEVQIYATKNCTDQLRALHNISLTIKKREQIGDVYIVTCAAKMGERLDEDEGAVPIAENANGIFKANAYMKCTTKAKRRVTLSIVGLGGILDESELDTVSPHRTFDAFEDIPPTKTQTAKPQQAGSQITGDLGTRRAQTSERIGIPAQPKPNGNGKPGQRAIDWRIQHNGKWFRQNSADGFLSAWNHTISLCGADYDSLQSSYTANAGALEALAAQDSATVGKVRGMIESQLERIRPRVADPMGEITDEDEYEAGRAADPELEMP